MKSEELRTLIKERFGSQANFSRASGIPEPMLSGLLRHPEDIRGVNAQRIQAAFDKNPQIVQGGRSKNRAE